MRLKQIAAIPHPDGNRIDLYWVNPEPMKYPGIRIVRRTGTHPISPEDGVIVTDEENLDYTIDAQGERHYSTEDSKDIHKDDLTYSPPKGETVYYYAWFPYAGEPPVYVIDQANRAAAMATSPYGMAEQMYESLPAIYHRYDASLAQAAGKKEGPLQRFLKLPGGQLDQLYSYAQGLLDLYDLDRVDGRLLPLLAQWIGWQTDYRQDIDRQRNEIRNAPYIYQTIGTIPSIEATVRRVLDWESHTKEFIHNIFLSNAPPHLNLWSSEQRADGTWQAVPSLLSLDFCYEGRGTAVCDADGTGTVWLFYHAFRKGFWEIRYKTFTDQWQASQPLNPSQNSLDRHPSAAWYRGQLWVFWDTYLEPSSQWQIHYRVGSNGSWDPVGAFADETQESTERRAPISVVDGPGLWLFWLERSGAHWRLRYQRYDGEDIKPQGAMDFPSDREQDPRVSDDVFVLFEGSKLWAFWSRKNAAGRWEIMYRCLDPATLQQWGLVHNLTPLDQSEYDDREPVACVNKGNIEVFWSSTRSGSRSIWYSILEDEAENRWAPPAPLALGPYSQHAPVVVQAPQYSRRFVIFRSNQSVAYRSVSYPATETLDARYGGSTTVEMCNAARLALRGQFEDFLRYTFDVGKASDPNYEPWYFGESIGIYMTPGAEEQPEIQRRNKKLAGQVLQQFLPIQIKPVFIIESPVYTEYIYSYDDPSGGTSRIIEKLESRLKVQTPREDYAGVRDSYSDLIPEWIWIRSCLGEQYKERCSVQVEPLKYCEFRTWHVGVTQKVGD